MEYNIVTKSKWFGHSFKRVNCQLYLLFERSRLVKQGLIHCEDCKVNIEGKIYGIKISKKAKRHFDDVSAKPKAVVCQILMNIKILLSSKAIYSTGAFLRRFSFI